MLLVDDLLTSPVRSLFWIFREIHNAAYQEVGNKKENITAQLSELYMMLETGQITEEEFEAQEEKLLDLLDDEEEDEEV